MSIIKSFSVDNGDFFYIKHVSNNFTIIDCNLSDENTKKIFDDLKHQRRDGDIFRFISTHPDEDHIKGIKALDKEFLIDEFYRVDNKAIKLGTSSESFNYYCELRDGPKGRPIDHTVNGIKDNYGNSSGLNFWWPKINNSEFKNELQKANLGEAFNNISPILVYSLQAGVDVIWLGDMETKFLEKIQGEIDWDKLGKKIDIVIAPHHGRSSGAIPNTILEKIKPKLIVVGEAPSDCINYYHKYNTITQNRSGDIIFDCQEGRVDIFVSKDTYMATFTLDHYYCVDNSLGYYIGSFKTK